LVSISARSYIGVGEAVAIPGLVIDGDSPKRVLVRGIGPGLVDFGVNNVLLDPFLSIVDQAGNVVASNDDWEDETNSSYMAAVTKETGAFALHDLSKDSAFIATLPPGLYTVIVSGVERTSGIGLVEVYEIP
jgi:hypothetical protein